MTHGTTKHKYDARTRISWWMVQTTITFLRVYTTDLC